MTRPAHLPVRFWAQASLAALTTILTVTTVLSREWVEILTGWDPDRGSGALEWLVVLALGLCAAALGLLARAQWLRAATTAPTVGG
ncbi:ABC transporter permease [Mangrovihabitans endophyticus]|uniref:Uncharacterized protein n=1 Tax=Mangrovihabitans endophyticus TaxID=1751298 RepID=A0A8J3BTA3_9ACTN|nr:ABC transporter permease [Mangrovihabitans endophyticus]GGK76444.1 hypothetical protein GCM10012284_07960 [Mangrovihabitans endophyticus]